jgi:bifunctional glutamyl/prolyl-tRNA synthetase
VSLRPCFAFQEGDNATFINWGNIRIKKIHKQNGKVVSVDAEANLDDKASVIKLYLLCT